MRRHLAGLLTLLAASLALAAPAPAADGGPPADYTATAGLSEPQYETRSETVYLPAFDGEPLYLEITRPRAAGRFPVILESSPYHGTLADRDGTRILPGPKDAGGKPIGLTGYFAPRGYAVVMMDLRGTGRSQGCLDHLGGKDARDLEQVVEWAASQGWSNGRVGMTGHSYVGSTPSVAAAQNPRGLATIVPSAGLASMYDHQFQDGVPYWLQWVGTMEAYEQIALERKLPPFSDPTGLTHTGDDFGGAMEETGCGLPNSSLIAGEDQLSGRYSAWHEQRDWRAGATAADIPVFAVHGVNDNAARVAALDWFFERRNAGDKLWLGQWDHGSGCCPTRRGDQWTAALHAWFDKQLAGRDVSTGPAVELFMSDGTFENARAGDRDEILTGTGWPLATDDVTFHPSAEGVLEDSPETQGGSRSFQGDARGFTDPKGADAAEFATPALASDMVIAGVPELTLSASVTAPRVHLISTLYDKDPEGGLRRIGQFAINPELRGGIANRQLVVPGQRYEMKPSGFAMAHHLRAGHRLVMRVTTADPDKVPTFATDPQVKVFTGPAATRLTVPVVGGAVLYPDDVPLDSATSGGGDPTGPAQAPVEGAATPAVPGAGARQAGVDSAFFEFDAAAGFDNARMVAEAGYDATGDVDLYLQRRQADGSWSGDIASGASSALDGERLESGRLAPGRYRIEVVNFAAPPGTRVDLRLTFFDSAGQPGG
jgi:putative CocE/NonD family hydrolase